MGLPVPSSCPHRLSPQSNVTTFLKLYKLEPWPGYTISVEKSLLSLSRILCTDTILKPTRGAPTSLPSQGNQRFYLSAEKTLLGAIIIAWINYQTYRFIKVTWIKYKKYYKEKYNKHVTNMTWLPTSLMPTMGGE